MGLSPRAGSWWGPHGWLWGTLGLLLSPSPGHCPCSSPGLTVTVEPSPEVPEGSTATMTCSATAWVGEGANYTWYRNSRWLLEGPSGSLVLTHVTSADTGSYHCRASGTRGSVTSALLSFSVLCECPHGDRPCGAEP